MPGEASGDPFYWDVERVVQELCSSNRTWDAPEASKMPDPVSLAQQLREHDIDGETLLGMDESDESSRSLCIALGVAKIRHQFSILKAIKSFRGRSRAWKKSISSDPAQGSDTEMLENHEPVSRSPIVSQANGYGLAITSNGSVNPPPQGSGTATMGDSIEEDVDIASPKKKRRIAPTNMSTAPAVAGQRNLPTEADNWSIREPEAMNADGILQFGVQGEFLGSGRLSREDILHSDVVDSASDGDAREFSWVRTAYIPPARRIQVNGVLKQRLRPGIISGLTGLGRDLTRDFDHGEDGILPAFGDSDDENEYDEETWREIEEEANERMDKEAELNSPYLGPEEIDTIIQQEIDNLKATWRETKLPRHERKAYKMWADARKHGTRGYQVTEANRVVHNLELRIENICNHMRDLKWARADKTDLQAQTASLKLSVFEREYAAWIIGVLNSPSQPAKPPQGPKPIARQPKQPKVKKSGDGDEEILTSCSEDELDDFIVDDGALDQSETIITSEAKEAPISEATTHPASSHTRDRSRDTQDTVRSDRPVEDDADMLDLTHNDEPPPYSDVSAVAEMGIEHWRSVGDNKRQVITLLYNSAAERRKPVLRIAANYAVQDAWQGVVLQALSAKIPLGDSSPSTPRSKKLKAASFFTKLFDIFVTGHSDVKYNRPVSEASATKIRSNRSEFDDFFAFLRSIVDYFPQSEDLRGSLVSPSQEATLTNQLTPLPNNGVQDDEASDIQSDEDALSPTKRRRRQIIRDQAALSLRENDRQRVEAQEARRKILREKLKVTDSMSQDETRLIINETRNEGEGFIYINKMIASRIKDHQIAGVRFMWDQVIAGSAAKQGCLLAHTMGLGKTMQIITLLVAIAEAAASPDPSISSQIPEHLTESKTLVLCPAGLVDNWMDELLTWTPDEKTLGDLRKIESSQKEPERVANVKAWASGGGVLIVGYPMFTKLAANDDLVPYLLEYPNIVIGDEAHKLQNPLAKVHQAAHRFRTTVRIAMTGSPLANNVEEYHSMINWVAPNYLGPLNEFKDIYAAPIKSGLWQDSDKSERRKALKMLKVLKETVAPKVHRATIAALRNSLPPKKEFIIYLKLTDKQFEVYSRFVRHLRNNPKAQDNGNTLFQLIGTLSLLLAHPKIFREKLKQRKKLGLEPKKPKANEDQQEGDLTSDVINLDALSDLLALLPDRMMEDLSRSYKMAVLVKILDEARLMHEKVLIFSQYLDTLNYIENLCHQQKRSYLRLDGSTATNTRQKEVKQFNSGNDEIYLISTVAGGIGLNIHSASRVVIFDYKFNPVAEQQAIGRSYRIGQTKPVYVYWLIFDGTFEKNLQNQAVFKLQLQSRVVDKKNPIARAEKVRDYCRDPVNVPRQSLDGFLGMDRILDAVLEDNALSSHITSIDVTDTFDEEEPEESLTSEEKKEVEKMILLNQLRWQNPEEYRRLEQENRMAQRTEIPPPSISQAAGLLPLALEQTPGTVRQGFITELGSSAAHLQSAQSQQQSPAPVLSGLHVQPQLTLQGLQAAARQTAASQDRSLTVIPPVLNLRPVPNSSSASPMSMNQPRENNLPVMGTGTSFRLQSGPRKETSKEVKNTNREAFLRALLQSNIAQGRDDLQDRAQGLTTAVDGIIRSRHPRGLPLKSAWRQALEKITNEQIVEHFLTNKLPPHDLVTLHQDQILARMVKEERHGGRSTPNGFAGTRGDPNHLEAHMRRSLSKADGGGRGVHAASDRLALEAVAARRAKQGRPSPRPDRLPSWAHQAVNRRSGSGGGSGGASQPSAASDRRLGDSPDLPLTLDD